MSRTDYIVKDLGEDTIAFKAEQLRGQLGLINSNTFSLTDAVENLETFDFGKKGRLSVVLINAPPSGTPAKVRFNPLNLIESPKLRLN